MRDFVRTTVCWLLVAIVGETVLAPVMAIGGIAPDFTVLAIVLLAMAEGPRAGAIGGFVVGLVQDLAVPTMLGLHSLCKTLLGSVVGRTRGRLVYGLVLVEALLVLVATLGHDTLFLLVQSRQNSEVFLGPWFADAIPTAVYTALVGVPVLRVADVVGVLRRED
jgi:rod shape-determining protein MreD